MQTLQAIDLQPLTVQPNVGLIQDLVNPSDGFLTAVLQSCRDTLGAELQDPTFTAITKTMEQWQARATKEYQLVDLNAAKQKAQLIMAEVTPVFATLAEQVNTTSLIPMVALDYLRLVPRGGASAVTLLGVGASATPHACE